MQRTVHSEPGARAAVQLFDPMMSSLRLSPVSIGTPVTPSPVFLTLQPTAPLVVPVTNGPKLALLVPDRVATWPLALRERLRVPPIVASAINVAERLPAVDGANRIRIEHSCPPASLVSPATQSSAIGDRSENPAVDGSSDRLISARTLLPVVHQQERPISSCTHHNVSGTVAPTAGSRIVRAAGDSAVPRSEASATPPGDAITDTTADSATRGRRSKYDCDCAVGVRYQDGWTGR